LMCVDSLLLKCKSDEKQFTRLFISVFASDSILRPPSAVVSGPCVQERGMTITSRIILCQWHSPI